MSTEAADLEVILRRLDRERYGVELRIIWPGNEADIRPLLNRDVTVRFDAEALRALEHQPVDYGVALGKMLFSDSTLADEIAKAHDIARSQDISIRLRITIVPDTDDLHKLLWETLRSPQNPDNPLLTTGTQVFFSRYLGSADWQPVRLRARGELRALVVIANPTDLTRYSLQPIDVPREIKIARDGLQGIALTILGDGTRATLGALTTHLGGEYDIVYLMAHGRLLEDGEITLFLENEQGEAALIAGRELVVRINELAQRPRLVVMATCQSADSRTASALTALGPRLAVAGVPAVLAMQGSISVETVEQLLPVFFEALQRDGQIDRALAIARGRVRDREDFWMPVLFMRLKSGRVWYTPDFTEGNRGSAERKWDALLSSINGKKCTPILGPDLLEGLLGTRRDLARELAEDCHFPLAPHDREGQPQVAQFLAIHQSKSFLDEEIIRLMCRALRRRKGRDLPPEAQAVNLDKDKGKLPWKELLPLFDTWLYQAWEVEQARNPAEPHCVLAGLNLPIYLTADPSDLLVQALRKAGKDPQIMYAPWNDYTRKANASSFKERDYTPTSECPLVFYLLGRYQEPDSLVLTEDHHFNYLIGITQNKARIPTSVRSHMADAALLFLGFRPDDWAFRVVFHSLMHQEGATRLLNYAHIAVQVPPEEGRIQSPRMAQDYLEAYFNRIPYISIYWGRSDDFVQGLYKRL